MGKPSIGRTIVTLRQPIVNTSDGKLVLLPVLAGAEDYREDDQLAWCGNMPRVSHKLRTQIDIWTWPKCGYTKLLRLGSPAELTGREFETTDRGVIKK